MLSLVITAIFSSALAAEMPFCQDISTEEASFGQVFQIQAQVNAMSTGFHCRGDHGERISGFSAEPSPFLAQCGNNLFAGETCYTGNQEEARELLKSIAEKGALGPHHSLRDVKTKNDLIIYSIQDRKGRVAPLYGELSAGRCTESSFAP